MFNDPIELCLTMKKILLPCVVITLGYIARAQPGDVQLEHLPQRPFHKISGNTDLRLKGFNRIIIGKNYRDEWMESISVPAISLATDFGGLRVEKEGGGKQTHSLYLLDSSGRQWVLRSVKKYPEKVITPELKGTIAERLIRDGISASHPYGVLSVGTLAKAAGLPYFPNTVVFIPDDPKLGEYRDTYKNTLSLLELRKDSKDVKQSDTEEVIAEIQKSGEKKVDQLMALRMRLLDNFIMDFDRHEGQWEWLEKDSAGKIYYYPVAKDRDQAFFRARGILPKKLSSIPPMGPLQGFRKRAKDIRTFNYSARNFDRNFLNELDESTWNDEIDRFLSAMTDAVIDSALMKQPSEIHQYSNAKIAEVLKTKRNSIKEELMEYYRFLTKTVSIAGTNDAEEISVTKNEGGSVWVQIQEKGSPGTVSYKRLFDPSVTDEIRIYGLEGDDRFVITGDRSPIKIRLIGGPGKDEFTNETSGKEVIVYDVSFENNTLNGNRIKNKINDDPLSNEFQRLGAKYNFSTVGIAAEYARDGGLFLGLGFKRTTYGFRKEPYAAKHHAFLTRALTTSAYHFHYDADLRTGQKTELLLRSDVRLPTVRTRFFGYGNNSVLDKSKATDYYLAQYRVSDVSLNIRHSLTPWFQVQYGPVFQYFRLLSSKNTNRHVNTVNSGNGSNGDRWYWGGEVKAVINARNHEVLPTRGIQANFYGRRLGGISTTVNSVNQFGSNVSLYTDFLWKKHIVLATSFGVDHNSGDFEIPQAQYLGFKQNLRGYRYQRFAGRTRTYNNSELRIGLANLNLFFVKGPFGILGFHDAGRVWMDGEESGTWHKGYGGGIWLAPFAKLVVTGVMMYSNEEKGLPLVTFGFQF